MQTGQDRHTFCDEITAVRKTWRVSVGGRLDESNTRVRYGYHSRDHQGFQPNVAVRLSNTGTVAVKNPWLMVNGKRDWRSLQHIIDDIHRSYGPLTTEKEKLLGVWRFFCDNLYDSRGGWIYPSDPVILLNSTGYAGCFNLCIAMNLVLKEMGFPVRFTEIGDTDHWLPEAYYDGNYHMVDSSLWAFFLREDGEDVAGIDNLQADTGLLRNSIHHNGAAGHDESEHTYYEDLLVRDKVQIVPQQQKCCQSMDMILRPGESLVRHWGNLHGKRTLGDLDPSRRHLTLEPSQGAIILDPDFGKVGLTQVFDSFRNAAVHADGSIGPVRSGIMTELILKGSSPYLIVGGRLDVKVRKSDRAVFAVDILTRRSEFPMLDIKGWSEILRLDGNAGEREVTVDLDDHIKTTDSRESFNYILRIRMTSPDRLDDIALIGLKLRTDIQCATYSLPGLSLGENEISYTDDTGDMPGKKMEIAFEWQECHDSAPPSASTLISPIGGIVLALDDPVFIWDDEKTQAVLDYQIQVSEYPDFRWPVSPNFDRYISRTRYGGQRRWSHLNSCGLRPGKTYYWRVRALGIDNIWSDWSDISEFRVQ